MPESASLRRFVVSCIRHFPAVSHRNSLQGCLASSPKKSNRVSIAVAICALVGTFALCGAIFAQQSSLKNRAPASAAKGSTTATLAGASESQPMAIETRLPATVRFYAHWRGTKTLDAVRAQNGLLRLWADPDFAPIRRALTGRAFGNSWLKSNDKSIRPEILATLLPLFENEAIIGSVEGKGGKSPEGAAHSGSGEGFHGGAGANVFSIYDGTGRVELIEKAEALFRATDTAGKTQLHAYMLGNIKIESAERAGGTDFYAQVGNYYLRASRKEVIEEVVARFNAEEPAGPSLPPAAVRKKARRDFGSVHAWGGSLSLEAADTRLRFASLGDTSGGSLFDIVGASTPSFESLPLARDGASFAAWRMNFPAIYQIFRGPFVDSLPPQKAGSFKGFDMLGQAMLGMPLPDILALLGGGVATISSAPGDATYTDLVAISIHKPDVVLGLLRKGLGPMIRDTTTEGGATVLELGTNSVDPATKAPRLQLSYVAVTPQLLIYSQRKTILLDAVGRASHGSDSKAESLAGDPEFQRARGRLPKDLTGFTYAQMSKQTWEREFAVMLRGVASASAAKGSTAGGGIAANAASDDWRRGGDPG